MWEPLCSFLFLQTSQRSRQTGRCRRRADRPKARLLLQPLEDRLVPSGFEGTAADVLSYHNNDSRTGANANETILTPDNVSSSDFGKLASYPVDGQVYAEPLYVQQLPMGDGHVHNVVFVATEHDSVYALDADNSQAGPQHDGVLWHDSFTNPGKGITAVPRSDIEVKDTITPEIGITGTPVIDLALHTMYFVTETKEQSSGTSPAHYVERIHAVDITTGREQSGGAVLIGDSYFAKDNVVNTTPIQVSGTGSGSVKGVLQYDVTRELQRPGLALDTNVPGHPDGIVFAAFGSTHDEEPYHGWMVGWDARSLKLYTLFCTTPNGYGGSLWQGGGAPVIDSNGNLIMTTGNGAFDEFTTKTPPGPMALGDSGFGLGYGGLNHSAAVTFASVIPLTDVSSTGLFTNGAIPNSQPRSSDGTFLNLQGTGIDFASAAQDPNGPHTFRVTLSYQGKTLSEQIKDLQTGKTYAHQYTGVDLSSAVGGNTAYVGFGSGSDSRQATNEILDWTYTSNNVTLIHHGSGFGSHDDLTANGDAMFSDSTAQLTMPAVDSEGSISFNQRVSIKGFTTTFDFQMDPADGPVGDGISFIIQADQGHQSGPNYSDAVLKLAPTPGTMHVADFFAPTNQQGLAIKDLDFGTAGTLALPSFPGTARPNLVVEEAKDGTLYVVYANHMGGLGQALQTITVNQANGPDGDNGVWGAMSFTNNTLYIHDASSVLKAYRLHLDASSHTMRFDSTPVSEGDAKVKFPGASTSVSADGHEDGIIWEIQTDAFNEKGPAVLRAYEARDLTDVLFESSENQANEAGPAVKFTVPTIANGKVFVGTQNELDIYGLKPSDDDDDDGDDDGGGPDPAAWRQPHQPLPAESQDLRTPSQVALNPINGSMEGSSSGLVRIDRNNRGQEASQAIVRHRASAAMPAKDVADELLRQGILE